MNCPICKHKEQIEILNLEGYCHNVFECTFCNTIWTSTNNYINIIKKTKVSIYVAGCIDEVEYRNEVDEYKNQFILLDPLKIVNQKDDYKYIVETDKELIQYSSEILIAYIRKYTCGTIMEIKHAFDVGIPVFVITDDKKFINDKWLKYHTTKFFNTTKSCLKYIEDQFC